MNDSEKITINMGAVDLGKVDLLVKEGVYGNRTDFIRTAIRSQIDKHNVEVQQCVSRHSFVIGVLNHNSKSLARIKEKGSRENITLIGVLTLADDVPVELASEVIESVRVRGIFNASPEVKAALADRML